MLVPTRVPINAPVRKRDLETGFGELIVLKSWQNVPPPTKFGRPKIKVLVEA